MNLKSRFSLRKALRGESGQTVVMAALLTGVVLGMGGVVVDVGHADVRDREASGLNRRGRPLAAASQLPITSSNESSNTVTSTATSTAPYRANKNAYPNLKHAVGCDRRGDHSYSRVRERDRHGAMHQPPCWQMQS